MLYERPQRPSLPPEAVERARVELLASVVDAPDLGPAAAAYIRGAADAVGRMLAEHPQQRDETYDD